MRKLFRRYRVFLILFLFNIILLFISPALGRKSFALTGDNIIEMLLVIPPIFVLLGLLDVWVEKEVMIKLMGEKSGIRGAVIAFLMGSAAAGPLYAAFPVAGILLKKGSKFANVLILLGAWSTTKIPLLLFEASAMGWSFMITRFMVNIFGIVLIAYSTEKLLNVQEKQKIYESQIS